MIRNKLRALWFDHRPVWKAHRKIFELEKRCRALESDIEILWADKKAAYDCLDAWDRVISDLCRGYDALASALIARGGDPNRVHPQTPPANR